MANNDDYSWETHRWAIAIEAADTWVDRSERGKKKIGDLEPLAELFRSDAPVPPSIRELLADLLSRHQLKSTTQRAPAHKLSESQVRAQVLAEFADEFRQQLMSSLTSGPITKAEMNEAVKVMRARAKATERGRREFDGKRVATQLRQEQMDERLDAFTNYYGFNATEHEQLKRAISGRHGPINRMKKKS